MSKNQAAFPQSGYDLWEPEGGMSLRDYFAAKCCAAIVSSISDDVGYWRFANIANSQGFTSISDWIASESYKQAIAMLAAREVSK